MCNNLPTSISSACSCLATVPPQPQPTQTTTKVVTTAPTLTSDRPTGNPVTQPTSSTAVASTTQTPKGSSTTEAPKPSSTSTTATSQTGPQKCSNDNCLRQCSRSSAAAASFCATYTASVHTVTTGLPAFVDKCKNSPSQISSACSCLATQTVGTDKPKPTDSNTPVSTSTAVGTATTPATHSTSTFDHPTGSPVTQPASTSKPAETTSKGSACHVKSTSSDVSPLSASFKIYIL